MCDFHVIRREMRRAAFSQDLRHRLTQVSDATADCDGSVGLAERRFTSSEALNGVFVRFPSDSDLVWL